METIGPLALPAFSHIPRDAAGIVVFAHGSGSSRLSPRNRQVAAALNGQGLATVLFDLLREAEAEDRRNVFDIPLLGSRMSDVVADVHGRYPELPVGLFGASTGAAAALHAAASHPNIVRAVVSRGGRPDLAESVLPQVQAPTLLIVGSLDEPVITMNRKALALLRGVKRLEIVAGATHLFEEPGTLDRLITLAADWFRAHLPRGAEK
jgi:putative phosphoribosyl transferase